MFSDRNTIKLLINQLLEKLIIRLVYIISNLDTFSVTPDTSYLTDTSKTEQNRKEQGTEPKAANEQC